MALHKIKDFYPDYREQFGDHDLLAFNLYAGTEREKVGSIDDLLVDDEGRFRYLVANTGAWIFGKKVLLPIGQTQIDYTEKRVYADGLSREQVENLPEYDPNDLLNYDYEERVRGVYRPTPPTINTPLSSASAGLPERSLEQDALERDMDVAALDYGRDYSANTGQDPYRYDYDPELYDMNERNHQTLKLHEERLIANKTRQKTGDVTIGKRVETETQHISVPVEKERVVIERTTPASNVLADQDMDTFRESQVVRMEVYEETPDIRKETFVREEVRIRKEIETNTIESDETIRREHLDIDSVGRDSVREQ